ncbi:hypothetical protein MBGDC06_00146 [Thermoplasmatales archaeon SCGC AB-539-C06]|nr:hypothetical protein MBGDC06_00146 [Thermoplasmatales archaeon SCGC AB-539-C06]
MDKYNKKKISKTKNYRNHIEAWRYRLPFKTGETSDLNRNPSLMTSASMNQEINGMRVLSLDDGGGGI